MTSASRTLYPGPRPFIAFSAICAPLLGLDVVTGLRADDSVRGSTTATEGYVGGRDVVLPI